MKILMASFTFSPEMDGVSQAAATLVRGFRATGWEVEVLTLPSHEPRTSPEWHGARIIEYQRVGTNEMRVGNTSITVRNYFITGHWDLIFFQAYDHLFKNVWPHLDAVRSQTILISHGFPGLVWYRMPRFPFGIPSVLRQLLGGLAMIRWVHKIDRVVYLSEHADLKGFYDHWLAKISGYNGRRVIPNGIDPDQRGTDPSGFRQRHGIPQDTFLFLCVANYSPRKNQAYAARAFRKAAIPNSRLVFIGSNINEHAKKFIREDRAAAAPGEENHVLWLENIDRESTLDAFEACDAFVLSALHEAQPISLLEAMRAEKPWIARKSGCIHLMEGGICVKSEKAMTQAMRKLASDPDLRNKLGRQGHEAVEQNYNREIYIQRYIDLVEELIPESSNS